MPEQQRLTDWEFVSTAPSAFATPAELDAAAPIWRTAEQSGTAAAMLRAAGAWTIDDRWDFDAEDWWFRCRFDDPGAEPVLALDGLATIAEVWVNGGLALESGSMFLAHDVKLTDLRPTDNELVIACRALGPRLAKRHPRPRWRTRLVESQALRWYRTSLLGRIPAWTPAVAPVGPWKPVRVIGGRRVVRRSLRAVCGDGGGRVEVELGLVGAPCRSAVLVVGDASAPLAVTDSPEDVLLRGAVELAAVDRWWPHTHGDQPLYDVYVVIDGEEPTALGRVAFRTVDVDRADGGFRVRVNGVDVFCRGACWIPPDPAAAIADAGVTRAALTLAREAGMNMLRLLGTMVYEGDDFFDGCDELGILVWQDFMFANMDYPADDPAFAAAVTSEAKQVLQRLQGRASPAILCGGSEIEQQAAMLGLPSEQWVGPLIGELLPAVCAEWLPDVPYVTSTPTGGALPFQATEGVVHYYANAYLRPPEDARRAAVRFSPECLAFSHVPEPDAVEDLAAAGVAAGPSPAWKERIPRDAGASWDFEDVRDHALARLFAIDPLTLRYADRERWLALGRVATGEYLAAVFAEWRRIGSPCGGALVYTLRDFRTGAGWGVHAADGAPKAAHWYLRRAFAPLTVVAIDEGLNGLELHLLNERRSEFKGSVGVTLYRGGELVVGQAERAVELAPHGAALIHADALFDGFRDLTYAYRFGPPGHDAVHVVLRDGNGTVVADAFSFPPGLPAAVEPDVGLKGELAEGSDGSWTLRVESRRLATAVRVEARGYRPLDNYFHLAPGVPRAVPLVADAPGRPPTVQISALNSTATARVVPDSTSPD